jgi:rod shape-determining protein MreC
MSHLFRFLKRNKDHCVIVIAVLNSFVLMSLDQTPFLLAIKRIFSSSMVSCESVVTWLPRMASLHKENLRLMTELGKLSALENRVREVIPENERLRQLLGFKQHSVHEFTPAEIVGMGTVGITGSIHLNIGSDEGCQKNMPLVTHKGVVGKLIAVGKSTSVGHLLADPNFRISAKVQRSRVLGIVRWLHGNICMLEGVPLRSDIQEGDLVITSGYSRIFPAGLPIGRVFEVSTEKNPLFQTVLIRTEVNFGTLEEVLVLKSKAETE